jgi:hypothetical protein
VSNAKSEGANRIVKLLARIAYGFRNPVKQRRRVRYAATAPATGSSHCPYPPGKPLSVVT